MSTCHETSPVHHVSFLCLASLPCLLCCLVTLAPGSVAAQPASYAHRERPRGVEMGFSFGPATETKPWSDLSNTFERTGMDPGVGEESFPRWHVRLSVSIPLQSSTALSFSLLQSDMEEFAVRTGVEAYVFDDWYVGDGHRTIFYRIDRAVTGGELLAHYRAFGAGNRLELRIGGGLGIYSLVAHVRPHAKVATSTLTGAFRDRQTRLVPVADVAILIWSVGRAFVTLGARLRPAGSRSVGPFEIGYTDSERRRDAFTVEKPDVPYGTIAWSAGFGFLLQDPVGDRR